MFPQRLDFPHTGTHSNSGVAHRWKFNNIALPVWGNLGFADHQPQFLVTATTQNHPAGGSYAGSNIVSMTIGTMYSGGWKMSMWEQNVGGLYGDAATGLTGYYVTGNTWATHITDSDTGSHVLGVELSRGSGTATGTWTAYAMEVHT